MSYSEERPKKSVRGLCIRKRQTCEFSNRGSESFSDFLRRRLLKNQKYVTIRKEQPCHCKGVGLPILHKEGEVMQMSFDFKDLMAFGMFMIALLTFIFNNRK